MSGALPSLDELAETLGRRGDDAERLELVERARRFKRAWVEMAEALIVVERSRAYERWGYGSLHEYAEKELRIRRATVEKLTLSYMTVRRHAPKVLARDGVERPVPTLEAVEYFSKAVGGDGDDGARADVAPNLLKELKTAIFDEGTPLPAVRKAFGPQLFPKPDEATERELLQKTRVATRRLMTLLRNVDSLPHRERDQALAALEALDVRVTALLPDAAESAA